MNQSIRIQLLNAGFKESPRAVVMRKWDEVQNIRQLMKLNGSSVLINRTALGRQEVRLMSEIETICKTRDIGNPVKGEAIEYKQHKGQ